MNHITGLDTTDNEGKFPTSLQPSVDNAYDIGRPLKRWRTGEFVSVNVGTPSVEVGATLSTLDSRLSVVEATSAVDWQTLIDAETTSRTAADTTLQTNIDAETTARTAADTTLQTNIDTETNARAAADTTLQTNIDAETTSRTSADTTLQTNINAETTARAAADTTLQTNIDKLRTETALTPVFTVDNGLTDMTYVTHSSAYIPNYGNYAFNGIYGETVEYYGWESNSGTSRQNLTIDGTSELGHYVYVDLSSIEQSKPIEAFQIWAHGLYNKPRDFYIVGSNDGVNFTKLYDNNGFNVLTNETPTGTATKPDGTSGTASRVYSDVIALTSNTVVYRYIGFFCVTSFNTSFSTPSNSSAPVWVQELRLFRKKTAEPEQLPLCRHFAFQKSSTVDKYTDEHIVLRWDGNDELMIKLQTAKSNVYATVISWTGGAFPSGQTMGPLTTNEDDYWQHAGAACVEFTIQCDTDPVFPMYRVFYRNTGTSGTSISHLVVTRYY